MKIVLICGASGMIGGIILQNCLQSDDVKKITSIVRRKSGITHPKLTEVIHDDFLDFTSIKDKFQNQDVCFFCIGVYTGKAPRDEFRKITVGYTKVFFETLRAGSDKTTVCFLSGQGADSTEKSTVMFAKDKGIAENLILKLNFQETHLFRPGYIYPVTPRIEPNLMYKVMRLLYKPFLSWAFPFACVTSEKLASVMVNVGLSGSDKIIYENRDIRNYNS